MDYVTLDSLKATLSLTGFSYADADITQAISAASRVVDAICDRRFYPLNESNDETRYFTAKAPMTVEITDCYALTSLLTDQDGDGTFETTWTLHSDFELQPDNADVDGRPWERVVTRQWGQTVFPYWNLRGVQVTGRFGWQTTPDEVVSLTTILANRLLLRARSAPFGVVSLGVESATRISKEDPDLASLVRDYVRAPIFVG